MEPANAERESAKVRAEGEAAPILEQGGGCPAGRDTSGRALPGKKGGV